MQVAAVLHGEELGGDHQTGLGVPVRVAVVSRPRGEGPPRVLVESDHQREIRLPGPDRVGGRSERDTTGRAAVADVDERDAGEAEEADHRVRLAGNIAAADGVSDVGPPDSRILEREPDSLYAHGHTSEVRGVPTERVHAHADDADSGHVSPPSGSKA
jgi:hypothetical protein